MHFSTGKKKYYFLTGRPQAMQYKRFAPVLTKVFQGIQYMPPEDNISVNEWNKL